MSRMTLPKELFQEPTSNTKERSGMTGNQRMRRQAGKRDKVTLKIIYLAYGTSEPAQELTLISYLFKILVKGNSPEERFTTPLWDLEQEASVLFFHPLVDALFCANKAVLQNLFWAFRKKTLRESIWTSG